MNGSPMTGHHLGLLSQAGSPQVVTGCFVFQELFQVLIVWRLSL